MSNVERDTKWRTPRGVDPEVQLYGYLPAHQPSFKAASIIFGSLREENNEKVPERGHQCKDGNANQDFLSFFIEIIPKTLGPK